MLVVGLTGKLNDLADASVVKTYMYGHTYSKSMDQPGKVADPARGQMNREK